MSDRADDGAAPGDAGDDRRRASPTRRDGTSGDAPDGPSGARRRRRDPTLETQRARASDLDRATFAKRRAREVKRRLQQDRREHQPGPPSDDDYVVADRSQVRRITGRPEALGDVLETVMADQRWSERMQAATVFNRWAEVVGEDVARNCDPVRLVGGVLVVAASSPSWATQLRYLAPDLALSVNRALGEPTVDRVEVTVQR